MNENVVDFILYVVTNVLGCIFFYVSGEAKSKKKAK